MRPMLATSGDHVPTGARWRHEVKWDGVRTLVAVATGSATGRRGSTSGRGGSTTGGRSSSLSRRSAVRLTSRNDNDITDAWPELHTPPAGLTDTVLDGEIIALNDRGVPDFRTLAERLHVRNPTTVARLAARTPATLMVFDVLRLAGEDLTRLPWSARRDRLESLDLGASGWQVPATYDDGAMLHEATRAQGLEGIVSKRVDSTYRPGERSPHWLKFPHRHRGSYVIGGWRPQVGTASRLAALLVGEPTAEGLAYRGRVGSGIGARQSRQLAGLLADLDRDTSPFADEVPRVDAEGTRWIEPVLVVDIDTHGTGYDRLRQPSYRGVRDDLTPEDLVSTSPTTGDADE